MNSNHDVHIVLDSCHVVQSPDSNLNLYSRMTSITPEVLAYRPPDAALKEFVPAQDRAFFADPDKSSLLAGTISVDELTPYIGTELKGIQLSKLTDTQKDELALLVAEVSSCTASTQSCADGFSSEVLSF